MTVIRPNSISGVTSITAQGGDITYFKSDGTRGNQFTHNVSSTGVITATKFVGPIEGDVTGSGANLTSIPAGQLTGTIADARISSSSVTQHVTSFDDDNIVNDISTLALKVSALENTTASNTNSTFADTYQDTAGVTALTNVARTSTDFIASVYSVTTSYDLNVAGTHGQPELIGLNTRNATRNSYSWTNDQVRGTNPGASK